MKKVLAILNSCFFILKDINWLTFVVILLWNIITLLIIALMSNPDIWLALYLSFVPAGLFILREIVKYFKKGSK